MEEIIAKRKGIIHTYLLKIVSAMTENTYFSGDHNSTEYTFELQKTVINVRIKLGLMLFVLNVSMQWKLQNYLNPLNPGLHSLIFLYPRLFQRWKCNHTTMSINSDNLSLA
jgi:hypothetical protein